MRVLVVSDREDVRGKLHTILEQHWSDACCLQDTDGEVEARSLVQDSGFDLVLLYTPLNGALGDKLARNLTDLTAASVIILTPGQIAGRMKEKLKGTGVFVAETPLKKERFYHMLDDALTASERAKTLFMERDNLRQQMSDLKVIEQAKLLLVECLKLSEEQAHKYIEREAMEHRKNRVEVARGIISAYRS